MNYLKKLTDAIRDDKNVFVEFLLVWIAVMLTSIVVVAVLSLFI